MFDFFIDTYKELVKGEDVESAKKLNKEKEKAEKIIYPKDVKIVTYVLAGFYILVALVSSILTIKFYGFGFSVVSSILLSIIAILIIIFLSRKNVDTFVFCGPLILTSLEGVTGEEGAKKDRT